MVNWNPVRHRGLFSIYIYLLFKKIPCMTKPTEMLWSDWPPTDRNKWKKKGDGQKKKNSSTNLCNSTLSPIQSALHKYPLPSVFHLSYLNSCCLVMSDSFAILWTVDWRFLCPWDFQARIPKWAAIPSPGGLPNPGIKPLSPALVGGFLSLSHWGMYLNRCSV